MAATTSYVILKNLQEIPGVGPSIAQDLRGLGIKKVSDLKGRDPERLYRHLCQQEGQHVRLLPVVNLGIAVQGR